MDILTKAKKLVWQSSKLAPFVWYDWCVIVRKFSPYNGTASSHNCRCQRVFFNRFYDINNVMPHKPANVTNIRTNERMNLRINNRSHTYNSWSTIIQPVAQDSEDNTRLDDKLNTINERFDFNFDLDLDIRFWFWFRFWFCCCYYWSWSWFSS